MSAGPGRIDIDITRTMGSHEIELVEDLIDAVTRAEGRRPLSDHLYLDLLTGGSDGFVGVLARDDGDRLVGYAQVSRGNDADALELVIRPDRVDELASLGSGMIEAALTSVADDGGGVLNWWVTEPTPAHFLLADESGLREGRRLHQMRRSLPTGLPVTIDTRSFVPGTDDQEWLRVNNRAFAEHDEQGGWTLETLRTRQHEPWFSSAGFRVLERDGRMAGFCWTKVHEPEAADATDADATNAAAERIGEIYVIAVDPDFHGLGLGKQLTLAGLESLADRGIATAMLYVDADNTPAHTLYERLGFHIHSTKVAFSTVVEPTKDHDT